MPACRAPGAPSQAEAGPSRCPPAQPVGGVSHTLEGFEVGARLALWVPGTQSGQGPLRREKAPWQWRRWGAAESQCGVWSADGDPRGAGSPGGGACLKPAPQGDRALLAGPSLRILWAPPEPQVRCLRFPVCSHGWHFVC